MWSMFSVLCIEFKMSMLLSRLRIEEFPGFSISVQARGLYTSWLCVLLHFERCVIELIFKNMLS